MFNLFRRKRKLSKRLSTTQFYSGKDNTVEQAPELYSLGFVKVFRTQHGVLRVSDLPKSTANLALSKGSNNTISKFLGITELLTTDKAFRGIPRVGERASDYIIF